MSALFVAEFDWFLCRNVVSKNSAAASRSGKTCRRVHAQKSDDSPNVPALTHATICAPPPYSTGTELPSSAPHVPQSAERCRLVQTKLELLWNSEDALCSGCAHGPTSESAVNWPLLLHWPQLAAVCTPTAGFTCCSHPGMNTHTPCAGQPSFISLMKMNFSLQNVSRFLSDLYFTTVAWWNLLL